MLKGALFLSFADLRHMLHRREMWLWAFVLPIVFFYFIGTITAHSGGPAGADQVAVLAPQSAGFLSGLLIEGLKKQGYAVVEVSTAKDAAQYGRRLVVPDGFTESVLAHRPVVVEFQRAGSGLGGEYDRVRVSRATYGLLADVIVASSDGKPLDRAAVASVEAAPRLLTLDTKAAGKRRDVPTGFEMSVPGSMVFFLLLVLVAISGATLAAERDQGMLRRLAATAIPRGGVVAGKWGARMLLACIQIVFSMAAGAFLFHVKWGAQFPMVVLVLIAYAAFCSTTGLLVGVLARTPAQAGAGGSIVSNALAAVGGCWWPAEIMPVWMQKVSRVTPPGIAMDALHKLVNYGDSAVSVVPHVLALGALALVAGYFSSRYFRYQ